MGPPGADAELSARFARPTWFFPSTDSTNDDAARLAGAGAPHGALVLAEAQRAGRGRLGRSWCGAPGLDLLFSLVLRPDLPPERCPLLTLAAGAAVAETLDLQLKWPNDVVGRLGTAGVWHKVAGLLCELEVAEGRVRHVVLGIGINVNQERFPADLPEAASLLQIAGRRFDRIELLERLLPALDRRLRQVRDEPALVLAAWAAHSAMEGRRVRVGGIEGIAAGLRADGALLLRDDEGRITPVLAGDVRVADGA